MKTPDVVKKASEKFYLLREQWPLIVKEARIWLKELYKWLIVIWPFYLFLIVLFLHMLLLCLAPEYIDKINNFFSAIFQMTGGLFVLYSIRSNMFEISKTTLKDLVFGWFRKYPVPFRDRTKYLKAEIVVATATSDANLIVEPNLSNIEEKVEYLLEEIKNMDLRLTETRKYVEKELKLVKKQNEKEQKELKSEVQKIRESFNTYVTSVKIEISGVAYISWGVLIPVILG